MQRMVFDIIHTHTFGASQDIQLLVNIRPGLAKSYLISAIRELFTNHAAASALKMTAQNGTQVAVANIHHAPQCSSATDHTVYSTRLEVGHLTVVDVETPLV